MTARRTIFINAKTASDARAIAGRTPEAGYGDRREAEGDCRLANSVNPPGASPFKTYAVEIAAFATHDGVVLKVERVSLMDAVSIAVLMAFGVIGVPVLVKILEAA